MRYYAAFDKYDEEEIQRIQYMFAFVVGHSPPTLDTIETENEITKKRESTELRRDGDSSAYTLLPLGPTVLT